MATLSDWVYGDSSGAGPSTSSGTGSPFGTQADPKRVTIVQLIQELKDHEKRERALLHLSKNRGACEDLPLLLWNSSGTIFTLLEEILSAYRYLSPSRLTETQSNRVCNALALLQCVASHPDTRMKFVKANLPLYLYPFLNNMNSEKPHEYLRLTSLGVIGALVKADDAAVVHFLLESQVFPCCLRCMEVGSELSKTVATFIVHKILLHDTGLKYCCTIAERFFAVGHVLEQMVEQLVNEPSQRLLKHIICCYLRLSESPRACDGLRCVLPARLRDNTFNHLIRDDPVVTSHMQQLMYNISTGHGDTAQPVEQLFGHFVRG